MLENFPDEIILEITKYLNFYARLNLVQTSRKLNLLIYDAKLFEELIIPRNHTDAVIELFKNNIHDGSKVKKLKIDLYHTQKYNLSQLSDIFPQVAELNTGQCRQLARKMENNDIEAATGLKEKLEKFDIMNCHESITILIEKYPFRHLEYLSLRPTVYKSKKDYSIDIFCCLKNAPALESLKLDGFSISLSFFENIHESSPRLKSLELYSTKLNIINEQLPSPIVPSHSLVSFIMTKNHEFFDRNCLLLEYIIQKYPRLKTLDFEFWFILPGIDRFVEEIYHTDRAYRQRLPELMPLIMPRIKTLKTRPTVFDNFINIMSPISSHLEEITYYTCLGDHSIFRSLKDLFYIQTLTLLTSLSVQTRGTEYLFNDNMILPNIKHLSIFDKTHAKEDPHLMLNQLLFTFRGLKTLVIESHTTRISVNDASDIYPSVIALRFAVPEVAPQVKAFIRTSLPHVTRIHWHTIENPRVSIFEFPKHTLSMFNLVFFNERFKLDPNRRCNIHYHISRDVGTKQLNYSVLGMHEKSVTENNFTYPVRIKVQIVCKELWHLMDQDIIIF
jgi:hypothetical protein